MNDKSLGKEIRCKCESNSLVKAGFIVRRNGRSQRYLCTECGRIITSKITLPHKKVIVNELIKET